MSLNLCIQNKLLFFANSLLIDSSAYFDQISFLEKWSILNWIQWQMRGWQPDIYPDMSFYPDIDQHCFDHHSVVWGNSNVDLGIKPICVTHYEFITDFRIIKAAYQFWSWWIHSRFFKFTNKLMTNWDKNALKYSW